MWQNIIVAFIVCLAVIFTVRKFYRSFKLTDRCGCTTGCTGGKTGSCCDAANTPFPLNTGKDGG